MQKLSFGRTAESLLVQLALAIMPVIVLGMLILKSTRDHFTYTLDDPYIHLALARHIGLGHYGINPNEFSAPSSSILWPFLLAPFSASSLFEYSPLLINCLSLCGLVYFLNKLTLKQSLQWRLVAIGVVLVSINAYGLVFTGMEHSLQLLLVCMVTEAITVSFDCRAQTGWRVFPHYGYIAIVLLPLVRYEGMAIALPALGYLFQRDDKTKAVIALSVLTLCIMGFSGYLYSLNLGLLPSSILVKSSYSTFTAVTENLGQNLGHYGFMLLPVALLCHYYGRRDPAFAAVIFSATALHLTFGKIGWFGRYEPYWVLFTLMLCYHSLKYQIKDSFAGIMMLSTVPFAFWSLLICTVKTPVAAANIYHQQAQTAKITQILGEAVAVNDLGLVALRSNHYVLDLVGLGNLDAFKLRKSGRGAGWIEYLMKKNAVKYAFIFDQWFPERPATWLKVADLKLIRQVALIPDTVSFYAVDKQAQKKLKAAILQYSNTEKPDEVLVTLF